MTTRSEEIIAGLVSTLRVSKPLPPVRRRLAKWVPLLLLGWVTLLILSHPIQLQNIIIALREPAFSSRVIFLALLSLVACFVTFCLGTPGCFGKSVKGRVLVACVALALLFPVLFVVPVSTTPIMAKYPHCWLFVAVMGLCSTLVFAGALLQGAVLETVIASLWCTVAGAALASFVMEPGCIVSLHHTLLFHCAPAFVGAAVGGLFSYWLFAARLRSLFRRGGEKGDTTACISPEE